MNGWMEWEEKRERRKEPKGAASLSSKQPAASSSSKRAGEQSGGSLLATVTAVQFWPCRKWSSLQSARCLVGLAGLTSFGWDHVSRARYNVSISQLSPASEGGQRPLRQGIPEVGPGHRFG